MIIVKLESKTTLLQILVWSLVVLLIYIAYSSGKISIYYFIVSIILLGVHVVSFLNLKPYVSHLEISENNICIVYIIKGKIIKRKTISKNDIEKFDALIFIRETPTGKIIGGNISISIIKTDGTKVKFLTTMNPASLNLSEGLKVHQSSINLIKASRFIPNFSYKVIGSNYVENELEKVKLKGKTFSEIEGYIEYFKTSSIIGKTILLLACCMLIIVIIALISVPISILLYNIL